MQSATAEIARAPRPITADKDKIFVASQWQLMWWRFRKHKMAVAGGVVTILFYLVAIFCEYGQIILHSSGASREIDDEAGSAHTHHRPGYHGVRRFF